MLLTFLTGVGLLAILLPQWAAPAFMALPALALLLLKGKRGALESALGLLAFSLISDPLISWGYALGDKVNLPFLGTWAGATLALALAYPGLPLHRFQG